MRHVLCFFLCQTNFVAVHVEKTQFFDKLWINFPTENEIVDGLHGVCLHQIFKTKQLHRRDKIKCAYAGGKKTTTYFIRHCDVAHFTVFAFYLSDGGNFEHWYGCFMHQNKLSYTFKIKFIAFLQSIFSRANLLFRRFIPLQMYFVFPFHLMIGHFSLCHITTVAYSLCIRGMLNFSYFTIHKCIGSVCAC